MNMRQHGVELEVRYMGDDSVGLTTGYTLHASLYRKTPVQSAARVPGL
jgi:hypothetical protein